MGAWLLTGVQFSPGESPELPHSFSEMQRFDLVSVGRRTLVSPAHRFTHQNFNDRTLLIRLG